MTSKVRLIVLAVMIVAACIGLASSDIFTSSLKIQRMVEEEELLLSELKRFIDFQFVRVKHMFNFYTERMQDLAFNRIPRSDMSHPNDIFKVIQKYFKGYYNILGEQFDTFHSSVQKSEKAFLTNENDALGAMSSLIRLQTVYNLSTMEMIKGNYLGYQGPELEPTDVYDIGRRAFSDGYYNESFDWLNTTLTLLTMNTEEGLGNGSPQLSIAAVKALMGRCLYHLNGSRELALQLYNEAVKIDPDDPEVYELSDLLEQENFTTGDDGLKPSYFDNFTKLCSLDEGHYHIENPTNPKLVCRYREALLPYYRFQEEILAESPFATVFYNVISDGEAAYIKDFVKDTLKRARIGGSQSGVSDVRTGATAWIYDHESDVAASVARRIELITGLDTDERYPDGPISGEALQIVNYGIGGHYDVHLDAFLTESTSSGYPDAGDRLATFLIYLSDVEKGGSTVFTQAGVSVSPVKNMALMWYNYDTSVTIDNMTHHAGCPVLIGQKWIANKWIWTNGNAFRRRCGLSPNLTQLDIEADMKSGYK